MPRSASKKRKPTGSDGGNGAWQAWSSDKSQQRTAAEHLAAKRRLAAVGRAKREREEAERRHRELRRELDRKYAAEAKREARIRRLFERSASRPRHARSRTASPANLGAVSVSTTESAANRESAPSGGGSPSGARRSPAKRRKRGGRSATALRRKRIDRLMESPLNQGLRDEYSTAVAMESQAHWQTTVPPRASGPAGQFSAPALPVIRRTAAPGARPSDAEGKWDDDHRLGYTAPVGSGAHAGGHPRGRAGPVEAWPFSGPDADDDGATPDAAAVGGTARARVPHSATSADEEPLRRTLSKHAASETALPRRSGRQGAALDDWGADAALAATIASLPRNKAGHHVLMDPRRVVKPTPGEARRARRRQRDGLSAVDAQAAGHPESPPLFTPVWTGDLPALRRAKAAAARDRELRLAEAQARRHAVQEARLRAELEERLRVSQEREERLRRREAGLRAQLAAVADSRRKPTSRGANAASPQLSGSSGAEQSPGIGPRNQHDAGTRGGALEAGPRGESPVSDVGGLPPHSGVGPEASVRSTAAVAPISGWDATRTVSGPSGVVPLGALNGSMSVASGRRGSVASSRHRVRRDARPLSSASSSRSGSVIPTRSGSRASSRCSSPQLQDPEPQTARDSGFADQHVRASDQDRQESQPDGQPRPGSIATPTPSSGPKPASASGSAAGSKAASVQGSAAGSQAASVQGSVAGSKAASVASEEGRAGKAGTSRWAPYR